MLRMRGMKVLVTGFEPFGEDEYNSSKEVVEKLPGKIGQSTIFTRVLPTVFGKAVDNLFNIMKEISPDVVICLGQAGGRKGLSIERIAINIDDARFADNEGSQPIDTIIQSSGDDGYFSTLPVRKIIKAWEEANIDGYISNTAGTYVCNHIMYELLYKIRVENLNIKAGFIHVPYRKGQEKSPEIYSMELDKIIEDILISILEMEKESGIYPSYPH